MASVSAGKCPRSVESLRLVRTKPRPVRSEARTRRPTISPASAAAGASGSEREFVRMNAVCPGCSSTQTRSSSSQALSTGTSWTLCTPVGSSSRITFTRPSAATRRAISSRCSPAAGPGGRPARSSAGAMGSGSRCVRHATLMPCRALALTRVDLALIAVGYDLRTMDIILYLVLLAIWGLIIGAFARLALPGKDPLSLWQTMAVGLAGSFIAGLVVRLITGGTAGAGFFAAFVVSVLIVYLIRRSRGGGLIDPGATSRR